MSWLFEKKRISSEKNGMVEATRLFGRWSVWSGGNGQASSYLRALWKRALARHIPVDLHPKKILILGLGLGDTLPLYKKRFPDAHITFIEADPDMVALAKTLMPKGFFETVDILIGTALEQLTTLTQTFDLIIVDIFEGKRVARNVLDPAFWPRVHARLHRHGAVIYNAFREPEHAQHILPHLHIVETWKYVANHVVLLRPATAGVVGAPLPTGYTRLFATPAFLERDLSARRGMNIARAGDMVGIARNIGPIRTEIYFGDTEPILEPSAQHRLVFWHPTTRTQAPPAWKRMPLRSHRRKTGFHHLINDTPYWESWSSQAKRQRQAWHKQTTYTLVEPTLEAFVEAYKQQPKDAWLTAVFVDYIHGYRRAHGDRLHFYAAQNSEGKLIAGFVALDIPESNQSFHVTSFLLPEARNTPCGVAVVDAWFADSQRKGFSFLDFDSFWDTGDKKNWKGFTAFKAQFGVHFIRYPHPFVRFIPKNSR